MRQIQLFFFLFRKLNQSVLKVPGVWSHVLKGNLGKGHCAPLGPLWEFGFMASIKLCLRLCRIWFCGERKRKLASVNRKLAELEQLCKCPKIVWPVKDAGKRCIPVWLPADPLKAQQSNDLRFAFAIPCAAASYFFFHANRPIPVYFGRRRKFVRWSFSQSFITFFYLVYLILQGD